MNASYAAIALVLLLAVLGGGFYAARASGRSACEADYARQSAAQVASDAAKRQKAEHAISQITDSDLDGRLDKWMRD